MGKLFKLRTLDIGGSMFEFGNASWSLLYGWDRQSRTRSTSRPKDRAYLVILVPYNIGDWFGKVGYLARDINTGTKFDVQLGPALHGYYRFYKEYEYEYTYLLEG